MDGCKLVINMHFAFLMGLVQQNVLAEFLMGSLICFGIKHAEKEFLLVMSYLFGCHCPKVEMPMHQYNRPPRKYTASQILGTQNQGVQHVHKNMISPLMSDKARLKSPNSPSVIKINNTQQSQLPFFSSKGTTRGFGEERWRIQGCIIGF